MVIHYETLISEENVKSTRFSEGIEKTLKAIVKFPNFNWDTERFKCLLNDNEGQFHRKKTCIEKGSLDLTSSGLNLDNGQHTMDIYQKKHITWINSAISNVQLSMKTRSIDSTHLSKYRNSNVKIVVCGW